MTKHSRTIPSHDNSFSRKGADSFSGADARARVLTGGLLWWC